MLDARWTLRTEAVWKMLDNPRRSSDGDIRRWMSEVGRSFLEDCFVDNGEIVVPSKTNSRESQLRQRRVGGRPP